MRKILSSVLALLMLLSAFSCLTIIGFAADTALTEKETNDEAATANEIKVAETNVGALQTNKDVDWYKFTSDKDYFTVTFGPRNVTDTVNMSHGWKATFYDSNMNEIACYVKYFNVSTTPEFPFIGTIYVKIEAYDSYYSETNNVEYVLTADTYVDAQWETEYNDGSVSANDIETNKEYTGALQSNTDIDWYKFVFEQEYFTISFGAKNKTDVSNMKHGWKLTFYDSEMNQIAQYGNYFTLATSPNFPIHGTIYVKVQADDSYYHDTTNVPYNLIIATYDDLNWEDEYNGAAENANEALIGNSHIGALQSNKDVDWYRFDADKDYFTISFGAKDVTDVSKMNYGWEIGIYDSNLNFIMGYVDCFESFTTPVYTMSGTIYVKVQADDSYYNDTTNVPYALKVNTYTDSQWEDEYNNASTSANKIEQGKKYKATLYDAKDVDFFKFKATSDAFKIKFSIDLSETSVADIKKGWKMTIYPSDSASSIVGNYTVSSIGSFETRTLPYEKDKEYFVKIEAADSYSGNTAPVNAIYNFEVIDATDGKKWEKENGQNAFEYATPVNSGEVVYGNLYSSSDYDHYKISVPTDGLVNFTFTREEDDRIGDGWKFYLKNAAGTTVFTGEVKDLITGKSLNIDVKKGNYYLIVTSKNSNAPASDIDYSVVINYAMYTPKITKIANASNGITVKWNKTAGVASYVLYRREYNASTKKWSGWKAIAKPSASTTSYVDKTAKSGVSYRYTLKGVYGNLSSAYVSTGTLLCLAQPKTTVKSVSNGINVAWTQSAGATGYTVYRMEYNTKTKKWSGWKNMGTAKATKKSWTDKSAKKGVTYKYTVKAVNGKTASSYKSSSSVKR